MKKKNILKNEEGFTLIEMIAVLVILGVLAAVAVPKFFSMQQEAMQATIDGGLGEGAVRFNHAYAKYILVNKQAPEGMDDLATPEYLGAQAATNGESVGDFTIKWTKGADALLVIQIVRCDTISDDMLPTDDPDLVTTKTLSGIEWYTPPPAT